MAPGVVPALAAIALWGALATLALALAAVPPFLLTGLALVGGAALGARAFVHRPPPLAMLALGVYGLFGFHFFLFLALRHAPPVEANLVNYLWPLLIVVLAPAIVPGVAWSVRHAASALLGFGGAAMLILAGSGDARGAGGTLGYAFAAVSAFIWSTYSLLTRRLALVPAAEPRADAPVRERGRVAWYCLVSGLASLACHVVLEPAYRPGAREWVLLAMMAAGPMGAAFYLWDHAMRRGDPRVIGNLAYLAPMLSTLLLVAVAGGELRPASLLAMAAILAGAALGSFRRGP